MRSVGRVRGNGPLLEKGMCVFHPNIALPTLARLSFAGAALIKRDPRRLPHA